MNEFLQSAARLLHINTEVARQQDSLSELIRKLREKLPYNSPGLWVPTGDTWYYAHRLAPDILQFRHLTTRRIPHASKDNQLGDVVDPTMLYKVSVHSTKDRKLWFTLYHQPVHYSRTEVKSDNKDFARTMNQVLNITPRIPYAEFHLPLQKGELVKFKREQAQLHTMLSAFI